MGLQANLVPKKACFRLFFINRAVFGRLGRLHGGIQCLLELLLGPLLGLLWRPGGRCLLSLPGLTGLAALPGASLRCCQLLFNHHTDDAQRQQQT